MNIAILTISSLSLVSSVGTLLIMAKTAVELKHAKTKVEAEVKTIQAKVTHNALVVKTALENLEF